MWKIYVYISKVVVTLLLFLSLSLCCSPSPALMTHNEALSTGLLPSRPYTTPDYLPGFMGRSLQALSAPRRCGINGNVKIKAFSHPLPPYCPRTLHKHSSTKRHTISKELVTGLPQPLSQLRYSQILKMCSLLAHRHQSWVPSFDSSVFQVMSFLPLTPKSVTFKQFDVRRKLPEK